MSKLAQGTQLYYIDPATNAVVEVDCVTAFNPGGNPASKLDDTCLADTTASSRPGLREPTEASLGLRPDPGNESHLSLFNFSQDDPSPTLQFALGWSDGIGIAPTADSNGTFNLPATRTWNTFAAYVADFPFDFASNSLVSGTVPLQRTGPMTWAPKTSP